jgi:hypothetical protein
VQIFEKLGFALIWIAAALAPGVPRDAGAEPPPTKDWEVEITPYAWGTIVDGSVETRSRGTEYFHVDLKDIINSVDLGAMGRVSARWHRWVAVVDGVWAKLEDDQSLGTGALNLDVDLEMQMGLVQALGGYRVFKRTGGLFGTPGPADERTFGLDLLAGINYTYSSTSIEAELAPIGAIPGNNRNFGFSKDWVAPFVGGRIQNDFTPRLRLETLGGVGAFGVGNAPDLSWQLFTLLSYRFTDHFLVSVGHRLVAMDDDGFDLKLHGPVLGFGFRF